MTLVNDLKLNHIDIVNKEYSSDSLKTESIDTENSSGQPTFHKTNLDFNLNNPFAYNNSPNFPSCAQTKKRKKLHATFLLLKKRLNLENFMRKTQIDSLLKKCKSKAFKTIHEALKKCLSIKLPRLPQNFITNIKIDFNKIYLEKTIMDIYKEFNIIPSVEEFLEKGYLLEDKVTIFRDFLNLKLKSVFEYYLNSKQYVNDYYHIHQREGEKFAVLFNYISKVFIQYYTKSKGNKPKNRCKSAEILNLNGMEDINEVTIVRNLQNELAIAECERAIAVDADVDVDVGVEVVNFSPVVEQSTSLIRSPGVSDFQALNKMKPIFKPVRVKKVFLKKKKIKVYEVHISNNVNTKPIFAIKKVPKTKLNSQQRIDL
jgi:hypothetical protein